MVTPCMEGDVAPARAKVKVKGQLHSFNTSEP